MEEKFQHNSTSKLYLKFTLLALHSVVIRLLLLSGLNPPPPVTAFQIQALFLKTNALLIDKKQQQNSHHQKGRLLQEDEKNAHELFEPPGGILSLKHEEEEEEEEEENNRWGAGPAGTSSSLIIISPSSEVLCLHMKKLHHAVESKWLWSYENVKQSNECAATLLERLH